MEREFTDFKFKLYSDFIRDTNNQRLGDSSLHRITECSQCEEVRFILYVSYRLPEHRSFIA
jgi:hypothetical protein